MYLLVLREREREREREIWRTRGHMHRLNHMQLTEERALIAMLKTPSIRSSLIFKPIF